MSLKNRAVLAVTTEVHPRQELSVWVCDLMCFGKRYLTSATADTLTLENLAAASTRKDIQDLGVHWFLCICCLGCSAAAWHWAWTWAFSATCVELHLALLWSVHSQWKWSCVLEVISIKLSYWRPKPSDFDLWKNIWLLDRKSVV